MSCDAESRLSMPLIFALWGDKQGRSWRAFLKCDLRREFAVRNGEVLDLFVVVVIVKGAVCNGRPAGRLGSLGR